MDKIGVYRCVPGASRLARGLFSSKRRSTGAGRSVLLRRSVGARAGRRRFVFAFVVLIIIIIITYIE